MNEPQARQQRRATNKRQFQTDRAESKTLWYLFTLQNQNIYPVFFDGILDRRTAVTE